MTKNKRVIVFILSVSILLCIFYGTVQASENTGIDDNDISLAVETELAADNAVSSHLIDVETRSGIVTLSGSVDNILARERALAVVRTVRGVKAIINKITVRPVVRTDTEIRAEVHNILLGDPATDLYEISTTVENGVVTLSGTVQSWPEKELAEEVVSGVRGVKEVINDIAIEYREVRPDGEIKADVLRRLQSDVFVDHGLINVRVEGGVVTLKGIVGSLDEKYRAAANAWVTGTTSVNDSALIVDWRKSDEMSRKNRFVLKSDEEMEKNVKTAFYYDPRLFSFDITVTVKNGTATLTGVVDNLKSKMIATEDAQNTTGVWRVKNHLKVRPTVMPEDSQLAVRIHDVLKNDPYLDQHDITLAIRNHKVSLYGKVNTYFEKLRAADILSRLPGVVVIENRLEVNGSSWEWKDDREILEDIKSELFWNVFIDSDSISVDVQNGVATLTGRVDTWQESNAAMENSFEGGARAVINHLKIREIPEL